VLVGKSYPDLIFLLHVFGLNNDKTVWMYLSELTDIGFVINSMHDFQDLRGGQEGTGDKQTLIVWGANSLAMPLDTIINSLKEITPELVPEFRRSTL
jgi:hypothetical protein